MATALRAAIDRRLQHLIIARACRRTPALRLMPTGWMRLAVAPTAARLRRSLLRRVLAATATTAIVLAVATLVP